MTAGCCCCRGALLTQVQLVFHQNPKAFTAGLHSAVSPHSVLMCGVVLSQVKKIKRLYFSQNKYMWWIKIYHGIGKGQTLSPLVLMLIQVQIKSGTWEQHFNLRILGFLQKVLMSVTDLSKGAVNSQHELLFSYRLERESCRPLEWIPLLSIPPGPQRRSRHHA